MQELADRVFANLPSLHPLKILAFGQRWQFNSSLEVHEFPLPERVCFTRAERDSAEESVFVPESELRSTYPGSEILDYTFDPSA